MSMDATPARKRPDYSHRPKGAWLWAALLPLVAVELWAVFSDVEWTLSRTVWWVLGPEGSTRWWLLGWPLWGLLLWVGPHFLWPEVFGGRVLLGCLAVGLVLGVGGVILNR